MTAVSNVSLTPVRLVGGTVLLAVAYAIAGRLGLLLAIPPGYATALWPPTGLALAGVLILGRKAAWGVGVGSFLANLWVAWSMERLTGGTAALAGFLGCGAAVGALAGDGLLRRDPAWSAGLEGRDDLLRFLCLGLPGMCAVTATWGVGCLLAFGAASRLEAPLNWITWWCGDLLGGMVFTPLVLTLFGRPQSLWRARRITVGLPLAGAFILSATSFTFARHWQQERAAHAQLELGLAVEGRVKDRLRAYETLVDATGAFLLASPQTEEGAFRTFVQAVHPRTRDVLALSWVTLVPTSQVEAFQRWASQAVHPGYRAKTLSGSMEGDDQRALVLYIEPFTGNEAALGLDLFSESARAWDAQVALQENRLVATRAISLVQGRRGFLLLRPAQGPVGPSSHGRGLVVAVIDSKALLAQALEGLEAKVGGARVSLWDGPGQSTHLLAAMRESQGRWQESEAIQRGRLTRPIVMAGAQWRLEVDTAQATSLDWMLWVVLSIGALFTGLLGSLLLLVTGRAPEALPPKG